ncbi:uncharacterized protein N7529_001336, partial [Penicillium soppii]|uniref:uncharacterized protein n=1 Tax=Penicillium soppii TaxID=69789 RepID=UPI0025496AAF
TDNLTYLVLSNPLITPSSSHTIADIFDPDFIRPSLLILVPPSLIRVGPNRRKDFVLYENMKEEQDQLGFNLSYSNLGEV